MSYEREVEKRPSAYSNAVDTLGDETCRDSSWLESKERARLMRRLDLRVMPPMILLYFIAFIDRINVGNAMTLGMQADLHLKDQVNTGLALFYVPYIVFELPSNFALKRFKPHVWLSAITCAFGIIVMCHGFVRNYRGFVAARSMLGVAETGIVPGCYYLMSMWYSPDESLKRSAFFSTASTLAGAFGSLLASAIFKMDGVAGYSGWRWIFIIEGLATVVLAGVAFFIIADFPEDAKWLTSRQREFVLARRSLEASPSTQGTTIRHDFKEVVLDYKSWLATFAYFGVNVVGYSLSYFIPTIIKGFHYSYIGTQLHSVPPFACSWLWAILLSFISAIPLKYAATILITMGFFGALPITVSWFIMNLEGHRRRAIGSALMVGFGNLGGIVAKFTFLKADAPRYHTGYSIVTFALCLSAFSTIGYSVGCVLENRRPQDRKPIAW